MRSEELQLYSQKDDIVNARVSSVKRDVRSITKFNPGELLKRPNNNELAEYFNKHHDSQKLSTLKS